MEYLNNNLPVVHHCGFDISIPLPFYWTFDRYLKHFGNSMISGIMKSQVLRLALCEAGLAMNRDEKSYDRNPARQKYCYPFKQSGICPIQHRKFYNGKKHRGCTKWVTIPDDLRLSIDRNSRYFKNYYSLRTESERYNSRFKNTGQECMWVRNEASVANLNTLAHISLLTVAAAAITTGQSYLKLKSIKRIA